MALTSSMSRSSAAKSSIRYSSGDFSSVVSFLRMYLSLVRMITSALLRTYVEARLPGEAAPLPSASPLPSERPLPLPSLPLPRAGGESGVSRRAAPPPPPKCSWRAAFSAASCRTRASTSTCARCRYSKMRRALAESSSFMRGGGSSPHFSNGVSRASSRMNLSHDSITSPHVCATLRSPRSAFPARCARAIRSIAAAVDFVNMMYLRWRTSW